MLSQIKLNPHRFINKLTVRTRYSTIHQPIMLLQHLPPELYSHVARQLVSIEDLKNLRCCCKLLATILLRDLFYEKTIVIGPLFSEQLEIFFKILSTLSTRCESKSRFIAGHSWTGVWPSRADGHKHEPTRNVNKPPHTRVIALKTIFEGQKSANRDNSLHRD